MSPISTLASHEGCHGCFDEWGSVQGGSHMSEAFRMAMIPTCYFCLLPLSMVLGN